MYLENPRQIASSGWGDRFLGQILWQRVFDILAVIRRTDILYSNVGVEVEERRGKSEEVRNGGRGTVDPKENWNNSEEDGSNEDEKLRGRKEENGGR